jgi:hypothetical protein
MSIVKLPLTDGSETLVDRDVADQLKGCKIYPSVVGKRHQKYAQIYKDKRAQNLHYENSERYVRRPYQW